MSREDGRRDTDDGSAFDVAVQRAVREMLDVEPSAGLRGRVLERIDASAASTRKHQSRRRILWAAIPLGAAAALVLALLPSRAPEQPRQPSPAVATADPARVPPVGTAPPVPTPARRTLTPRRVVATARPSVAAPDRLVAATAFEPAESTTNIAPLETITPIELAPLAEHRVAPADLSVRPLNPIAELQIAPLNSPPDRRN